jgi:hypothetical protein
MDSYGLNSHIMAGMATISLPGEHCLVPQNHQLETSGEYPPGSQIQDKCPIGMFCGKVKYPGTNYLLGE